MAVPGSANLLLLGGEQGYKIERSLRFNSADSAYLNRNFGTPTDNIKWTWSGWVKRSAFGSYQVLFIGDDGSSNNFCYLRFSDVDKLECYQVSGGSYNLRLETNGVFRDPSAWYHIVLIYDSANATSTDRVQVYVNSTRQTVSYVVGPFSQNTACQANVSSRAHAIGRLLYQNIHYFNGYLTEINFIDGQALTPSSFGETDTITGVWKPKKYTGTYSGNSFYLNFADNSGTTSTTLGKDSSGLGNNFTPNNFSVTAGAGNDSLIDTPTPYADGGNGRGNYCTWNPVNKGSNLTLSNGNLDVSSSSGHATVLTTVGVTSGMKSYMEFTVTTDSAGGWGVTINQAAENSYGELTGKWWVYDNNSSFTIINQTATAGYSPRISNNDVLQLAIDYSTGKVFLGINNVWINSTNGTNGDPATGANPTFTLSTSLPIFPIFESAGLYAAANFGQRAFAYTPPSGFLALNTQNLPDPTIKKPSSYMNVKLYTGTSATQSITGLGFSPDLVWVKNRGSTNSHALFDSVRGAGYKLSSNETSAQLDNTANFTAFTSDGFTVASDGGETNLSSNTYVAWCWDESATPGFDIVTYSGNGATPRSISHSLGVSPSLVIVKNRTTAGYDWPCYHTSLGNGTVIFLQLTSASDLISNRAYGGVDSVSSTTFTVKSGATSGGNVNANGDNYVAYLWSEVAGFSKFGSYVGNGSSDGPFCFCGFKARWIMVKRTDTSNNWEVWDTARSTYNVASKYLSPNLSDTEYDFGTTDAVDVNANGFKLRASNAAVNASGGTYVFAAFSESPFKYSLAR